jgi:GNAT superfamily N-acetyltransferase
VEPAARRQGLARELLMALAQQFPGIGTSVTVPETFTPLFAAAGYSPLSLQQYEMTMDLADAKSLSGSVRWTAKNSTGRR